MNVEVSRLRKHYGAVKAVDDITFAFASGDVFGFVGPNGAGKTTTMRIMATLEEPTAGDILIDGQSVTEEPEAARRVVGFVPDSLPTHFDITVHEYLDFFARAYGLRGAARTRAVSTIEEFTHLGGIRDKLLRALSKGMKQHVSLGRALVHDPKVLIMDEPAAGLDPRARIELRELLAVIAEQKKAILISSHILTELTEMCNGVVIIEHGRLVETGTIREVLERGGVRRRVTIRCLGGVPRLVRDLLETPGVRDIREASDKVDLEVDGGDDECAAILAGLVAKGHRVIEFHLERADLEDLFMSLTKGDVA